MIDLNGFIIIIKRIEILFGINNILKYNNKIITIIKNMDWLTNKINNNPINFKSIGLLTLFSLRILIKENFL